MRSLSAVVDRQNRSQVKHPSRVYPICHSSTARRRRRSLLRQVFLSALSKQRMHLMYYRI